MGNKKNKRRVARKRSYLMKLRRMMEIVNKKKRLLSNPSEPPEDEPSEKTFHDSARKNGVVRGEENFNSTFNTNGNQSDETKYVLESNCTEPGTKEIGKVESSIGNKTDGYIPTLWYYEHLNFLSGGNHEDDKSDSASEDDNNETVFEQIPSKSKTQASEANDVELQPNTSSAIVQASAAAFGHSVGAQLQHLSKVQRCIAEKLISDVIYHGKMENLTMNSSVNLKVDNTVIPKSEPSWYDTVHSSQQESSSSCTFVPNASTEKQIDDETQSAVNCIKFELDESHITTFHITQNDLNEQTNAVV